MKDVVKMGYENLAVVPARGNSKGVPKKNLADLAGKPLLAYGLTAIQSSANVNRIVVSTDDAEIADAARRHGAEVPFIRPARLAEDATPTIPVILHALEWLASHEQYTPDYVLVVQPTEPFIRADQIDRVFETMLERKADSGITMIQVPRPSHPYHVRHLTPEGCLVFDHPDLHDQHPNRQSDPKRYAFGNLYWVGREIFLNTRQLEAGRRIGVEIDPVSAFDINTPEDLEIARSIAVSLNRAAR